MATDSQADRSTSLISMYADVTTSDTNPTNQAAGSSTTKRLTLPCASRTVPTNSCRSPTTPVTAPVTALGLPKQQGSTPPSAISTGVS
jgi:hypothetical protein